MATKTKKSAALTLKDRLSRLTYTQACKLLGANGKRLLQRGATWQFEDCTEDVYLRGDLFRLRLGQTDEGEPIVVTITLMASAPDRLHFNCTACETKCEHLGAAFSLILEEKLALGLAAPPPERVPMESLDEEQLVEQAIAERQERADKEKFRLKSRDPKRPWTDYTITSAGSGKTYRLALRGEQRGESFCSCPDFRTNTLGTCKHLLYALNRIRAKFTDRVRRRKFKNKDTFVHLSYLDEITLHLRLPDKADQELLDIAGKLADKPVGNVGRLVRCLGRLEQAGYDVVVYPDAEEFIHRRLLAERLSKRAAEVRSDPVRHPLRTELLKAKLLPYQLDGIAFASGTGRAILADDMGLGKTIQGIGVGEFLAREANIQRVLVVCPASVKSQWRNEIHKFSDRDVQIVAGSADERTTQYDSDRFFTICNYEQVLRDLTYIEQVPWDLIILDEGQRIKNWESKTAKLIKSLRSTFALVLSGTPLENRLDDLYSVAQFIDDRRLGPAFRFFNQHRIVDEKGAVLGYKNLDELRRRLQPVLLRRTRAEVLDQLPPRTTEIVRIEPTGEQFELHQSHMRIVSSITRKAYISEMDLLRLQKALLMCRMSANSTFLVDKEEPGYSSKLCRIAEMIEQLFAEDDRKAVLFSEWTTMLNLIQPILDRAGLDYVRLDGSVPQKKRQELVNQFQKNDDCRLFLTTNAGATGLNLQAANTVINVDLPWNPAVLEQRIARAHRMGQRQPVQVFALVTEHTIEERLLSTLSAKHELSLAVLDAGSDVSQVDMVSGIEGLRRRLEVLLGAKEEAPLDESRQPVSEPAAPTTEQRQRVAAAGGELLGAAFHFLGELVAGQSSASPPDQLVSDLQNRLSDCVQEAASGEQQLTITLPNRDMLDNLAQTMARLLVAGQGDDGESGAGR